MEHSIQGLAYNQFDLLDQLDKSDLPLEQKIKLSYKINQSIHRGAQVILQHKRHAIQAGEIFSGKDVVFEQPKAVEPPVEFYTIVGYFKCHKGVSLDVTTASSHGMSASRYCREHDITVKEVPHPTHGSVNSYPKPVLDKLFGLR